MFTKVKYSFPAHKKEESLRKPKIFRPDTMNTFHAIRYLHSSDSEQSRIKLVLHTMLAGLRKKGNDYGIVEKNNPIRNC